MTTGLGFDVHKFSKQTKKPLILAGVEIPAKLSLDAVSDGDVVLHAIADAICGSAGIGDIGDLFPPDDEESKNLDSKEILRQVLVRAGKKFKLLNVDITIISEKPRLVAFKPIMLKSLCGLLSCKKVNLKIKSKEGLNILGGINSIACMVIILAR